MAQWRELLKLDPSSQSRVCRLYDGRFPREIRHYLSDWIESQNWEAAASDEPTARTVLQALLVNLEELRSESVHNSNVLMGPDYSAMKDFVSSHFETCPTALAVILSDCLREEKNILTSCLKEQHCSIEEQKQKDLDDRVKELIRQTWETEREIKSLEALIEKLTYIQRTWESQVEKVNGLSHDIVQQECLKQANFIAQTKQVVMDQVVRSVNLATQIIHSLVSVELPEWKRRQQLSCIGNPVNTSLEQLDKWFSAVGEMLLQIIQQLKKLQEQSSRAQSNDVSHMTEVLQEIHTFTTALLTKLLQNALVVEKQPRMTSMTHRPCILKVTVGFTVTLRFLVNLPIFKCLLKVKPVFDKDVEEVKTMKGFRQFVFSENNYKILDVYTPNGGLVAEFGHLSIKKGIKSRVNGSNECSVAVTEELHVIKFVTTLQLAGLECHIEASSLPVVVVFNTSQAPSAWASIMWHSLLSATQPASLSVFVDPPPLSWGQLSQALSWQFLSAGDRALDQDQLNELKLKVVDNPDDLVYWNKFAKNDGPWIWIDGILDLIQKHLKEIWRDGCVMGFVNKVRTRQLLQNKQSGNFLLRFSESHREGAITFSWVEHSGGEVNVHAVQPYAKKELSAMSLPDIIYHYSLRARQRRTTNPLVFLYPDRPKDTVFGPYYTTQENSGATNNDGYINRQIISVSDCPTPPPSPPRESHMDAEADLLQAPASASSEDFLQDWLSDALDTTPLTSLPPIDQMFPQLINFMDSNDFDMINI